MRNIGSAEVYARQRHAASSRLQRRAGHLRHMAALVPELLVREGPKRRRTAGPAEGSRWRPMGQTGAPAGGHRPGTKLASAAPGDTLCPGSASTAPTVPSCGARTTIRCRASFSADSLRQRCESRSISPWPPRAPQRQPTAFALERREIARQGAARWRSRALACARRPTGLRSWLNLRGRDEVFVAQRLQPRQRLLRQQPALPLQRLLASTCAGSRCILDPGGRSAPRPACSGSDAAVARIRAGCLGGASGCDAPAAHRRHGAGLAERQHEQHVALRGPSGPRHACARQRSPRGDTRRIHAAIGHQQPRTRALRVYSPRHSNAPISDGTSTSTPTRTDSDGTHQCT